MFLDLLEPKNAILSKKERACLFGQALFLRYLADSNRRPRFCRPVPNHSGKVPYCGCKDTTFFANRNVF